MQKFSETPPQTGMQMSNIYESVLNFFSKNLVFAIAKCPFIVRGNFSNVYILKSRVLVNMERSYLRIRSSEKISKYFQEKDEV